MDSPFVNYFDEGEVSALDRNTVIYKDTRTSSGDAPRKLYESPALHPAPYLVSPHRDLAVHYIIGKERLNHPDHSSRFGYARCHNGYCSGAWPGRYNEPPACSGIELPQDVAPARFYGPGLFDGPYNTRTQASVDYYVTKNYLFP